MLENFKNKKVVKSNKNLKVKMSYKVTFEENVNKGLKYQISKV